MVDHVGKLIAPEQHGFLPGRSCTSNFLDSMDVILDMIDDGLPLTCCSLISQRLLTLCLTTDC